MVCGVCGGVMRVVVWCEKRKLTGVLSVCVGREIPVTEQRNYLECPMLLEFC